MIASVAHSQTTDPWETRRLAAVTQGVKIVSPYVRVSKLGDRDEETFLSPDLQLEAIRREIRNAQAAGQAIVEGPALHADVDETGLDFNRQGITEALALKRSGQIHGIAVLDVSRVGRTPIETLAVIEQFRADDGVFISSRERIDGTVAGDMNLMLFAWIAGMYSDGIASGWRSVIEHRAKLGHQNGSPPKGYRKDLNEFGKLLGMVIDPVTGPVMVEAFRRYGNTKESVTSIERWLQDQGVLSLKGGGKLKSLLGNPFYLGQIRVYTWTGKARKRKKTDAAPIVVEGLHPPLLVTADGALDMGLWDRVQKRLAEEKQLPSRHVVPVHALGGLARCPGTLSDGTACKRALICQLNSRYPQGHYRCHNAGCTGVGSPRIDEVEAAVLEDVRGLHERFVVGDPDVADAAARKASVDAERRQLTATVTKLNDALAAADADLYADVTTPQRHRAAVLKIQERIEKATTALAALGDVTVEQTAEEFVLAAQRLAERWDVSTPAQRNGLLRAVGVRQVEVRRAAFRGEPVADRVTTTLSR